MRIYRAKLSLVIVLGIALLASLPVLPQEAQAWRGGGGFHGGGFGGFHGGGFGGFHGGGGFDGGFGGGSFHQGGFDGGRWGDQHYNRWNQNVNVNRNVNVSGDGGWGYYGGGGWGGAAAGAVAGAVAGLAIGAMVNSLPSNAQPLVVNNQNYYYDGTNYYQSCYGGSDTNYCVVPDPNQ